MESGESGEREKGRAERERKGRERERREKYIVVCVSVPHMNWWVHNEQHEKEELSAPCFEPLPCGRLVPHTPSSFGFLLFQKFKKKKKKKFQTKNLIPFVKWTPSNTAYTILPRSTHTTNVVVATISALCSSYHITNDNLCVIFFSFLKVTDDSWRKISIFSFFNSFVTFAFASSYHLWLRVPLD